MSGHLLNVLLSPHLSEKAALLGDKSNQYVFKVRTDSTKTQVKKAVESAFKVTVTDVNVINTKPRKKRHGRVEGTRKAWKKAIVSLKKGDTIDFGGTES